MKKLAVTIICLLILLFLSGCFNKTKSVNCTPLLKMNSVNIMDFDTQSVIDEFGAGSSTLRGITSAIGDELEKTLFEKGKFSKIVRMGSECTNEMLRVEGKLVQIRYQLRGSRHRITDDMVITRTRGKYEMRTSARILNCQTGETLFYFETDGRDSDLHDLSKEIGRNIAADINKKVDGCN